MHELGIICCSYVVIKVVDGYCRIAGGCVLDEEEGGCYVDSSRNILIPTDGLALFLRHPSFRQLRLIA